MSNKTIIKVFEFDIIKQDKIYDGIIFEKKHLESIQKFNTNNKNKYFTLIHNGVKFKNYVGVLKIGKLTIEILPKVDKTLNVNLEVETKESWKIFLLQMLKISGFINITSLTHANLKLRNTTLLDIYIQEYLKEVTLLLRKGLRKQYRFVEDNTTTLKGRLLFHKQIQKNLIHKERFYTSHQTYDKNHKLNQILLKALNILHDIAKPVFIDSINRLKLDFPELDSINVTESTFKSISYNRNNNQYQKAIELAKLIILNFSPDIQTGNNNVIAILFDMNDLWEKYVYRLLSKDQIKGNFKVSYQNRMKFWNNKLIKPDIVLKKEIDGTEQTFIIDTKWKLIDSNKPSDNDLKQMYVYNMYWDSFKSILLYPTNTEQITEYGKFHKGRDEDNLCKLGFLKVYEGLSDNIKLKESIYKEINHLLE